MNLITLPGHDEMLRRLAAMDNPAQSINALYPAIIENLNHQERPSTITLAIASALFRHWGIPKVTDKESYKRWQRESALQRAFTKQVIHTLVDDPRERKLVLREEQSGQWMVWLAGKLAYLKTRCTS